MSPRHGNHGAQRSRGPSHKYSDGRGSQYYPKGSIHFLKKYTYINFISCAFIIIKNFYEFCVRNKILGY